jgi:methylated-DNA-[protein]-cysteine S-methyltransferase
LPALDPAGTAFQREVWQALLSIAPGQPATYGALAGRLGRASAARALGAAVGRNPISVLVPCHRVIGADGSLTGYAGGLARKQALLALESTGA